MGYLEDPMWDVWHPMWDVKHPMRDLGQDRLTWDVQHPMEDRHFLQCTFKSNIIIKLKDKYTTTMKIYGLLRTPGIRCFCTGLIQDKKR